MSKLRAALLTSTAAILFIACARGHPIAGPHTSGAHAQSPPASPASSSTAPPTPAPTSTPLPTELTVSGPFTASIQLPQSAGTCTVVPGGFEAQIPFADGGTSYEVDIQLLDYTGPGTYQIPPDPVAIHTVEGTAPSALFPMVSGTVTVSPTEKSGSVDGTLSGAKPGKLDGT